MLAKAIAKVNFVATERRSVASRERSRRGVLTRQSSPFAAVTCAALGRLVCSVAADPSALRCRLPPFDHRLGQESGRFSEGSAGGNRALGLALMAARDQAQRAGGLLVEGGVELFGCLVMGLV